MSETPVQSYEKHTRLDIPYFFLPVVLLGAVIVGVIGLMKSPGLSETAVVILGASAIWMWVRTRQYSVKRYLALIRCGETRARSAGG